MNSNDWVAEHVMGFERGNCWSVNSTSSSRSDGTFETWFSCDQCGRVVYNNKTVPCLKYPFPKFTLVDLMRKLGDRGYYVMVRYDALRSKHNFTVTLDNRRIADTGYPLEALRNYLYTNSNRLFPKTQSEAEPIFFANIRDAIKLLQKAVGQDEGK